MSASAMLCVLFVALFHSPAVTDAALGSLKEVFGWKQLDFAFTDDTARETALNSGYFVPGNSQPIDIQHVGNRVFLTMPRWKEGIPATLATVPDSPVGCVEGESCAPLLNPYPNWTWNSGDKSCEGLTSVFRVNVDKCGRLWVLDSGTVNILSPDGMNPLCPAQLLSFDLSNDQLIRKYKIPTTALKTNSLLVTVALDTISNANNCENTFAYSADVTTYGLVVTDTKRDKSWRVEHRLFYPYPNWGLFNVAGESFELMDGLLSLAMHPDPSPQTRRLYFHAMASARENYVPANILRNATQANARTREYIISQGEKPSQAAASAFDNRGILFFGLLSKNSLACYNPSRAHIPDNIIDVAQDDVALRFATGVKVDSKNDVWVMTSRFSSYFLGTIKPEEVNFRAMSGPARELTRGTPCDGGGFSPIIFH